MVRHIYRRADRLILSRGISGESCWCSTQHRWKCSIRVLFKVTFQVYKALSKVSRDEKSHPIMNKKKSMASATNSAVHFKQTELIISIKCAKNKKYLLCICVIFMTT